MERERVVDVNRGEKIREGTWKQLLWQPVQGVLLQNQFYSIYREMEQMLGAGEGGDMMVN